MSSFLLETRNASLSYFDGDTASHALRDATVGVQHFEVAGIMGPSGSGKSSLLYLLSGLKRPTSGEVVFKDQCYGPMSQAQMTALRRRHFGFVFQQPWLLTWQTAFENALMGAPTVNDESFARGERLFAELGIARLKNKLPSHLSGGEKQRVCVARAMMNEPEVIFADEPTASLDRSSGKLVVELLSAYRDHGSVIIVTHDAEMLRGADRVLLMRDGAALEWISADEAISQHSLVGAAVSGAGEPRP